FVVDFSALVMLTELAHVHYLASAAVAFLFGLTTNYALSVLWVFDERTLKSRSAELLAFIVLCVIGLGLNEGVLIALSGWCGLHYTSSKCCANGLTLFWHFFSKKYLLFTAPTPSTLAHEVRIGDAGSLAPIAIETAP